MVDDTASDSAASDNAASDNAASDNAASDNAASDDTDPDGTAFDWRAFLAKWSAEWADSLTEEEWADADNAAAARDRWLGFPPASEERIVAMERRLGRRMPPSYREFLKVSDGWRDAGGFVWLLAGTAEAHWHDNASGLAESFEEYLDEDSEPEEWQEAEVWRRGLQLDVESDITYVLLDPEDVAEDGEWAVRTWSSWRGELPERHGTFRDFMRDMYQQFHRLRADGRKGPFENDTTRALDTQVEAARPAALRGEWERAADTFDEAGKYGRPRVTGLRAQLRHLVEGSFRAWFGGLGTDRRYAPDLLPVVVAEHARHSREEDAGLRLAARGVDEDLVALAHSVLAELRNGTYRYTAPGPFGEAVARARELARWGETDEAWATLRDALPLWEPLGPDHLAPLGWCADPLLGTLLTPERGRELLATPRGGQSGTAPEPTAPLDPGDLAWLAVPDSGDNRTSYRFVLVEGVGPEELPARLAAPGEDPPLSAPVTSWDARWLSRGAYPPYEDRATVSVGRAGPGWSFAFDCDAGPFNRHRFFSPAAAASVGTRSVVVWSDPRGWGEGPSFHLSVARDGVEEYAFTYADGKLSRSGEIPEALAPDRFFATRESFGAEAERSLLEALGEEFGVLLPRRAIERGRLHAFTTRSWTRPPQDGERYVVVTLGLSGERPADVRQRGEDDPGSA